MMLNVYVMNFIMLGVVMLSVVMLSIVMLSVIILSIVMLGVVMLSADCSNIFKEGEELTQLDHLTVPHSVGRLPYLTHK